MGALAWPIALVIVAALGTRFAHKWLSMSAVTAEHLEALSTLTALYVDIQNKLAAIEKKWSAKLEDIETRAKTEGTLRAVFPKR